MELKLQKVESRGQLKEFINSQWNFYKNNKFWVPPIKIEKVKLLDIHQNPFFLHSEIAMYLAKDGSEVVGRIAAIINSNHNETHNDKVGFFGFFECIDNQEVANALFTQAIEWLKSKGMDTIRGPVNPSMNDEIGMLINAFELPPVFMMTYNPPYYVNLVEEFGFTKAKDVFAYKLVNRSYASEKMIRFQKIIREKYGVTIRQVNLKNKEQYRKDVDSIKEVYNSAWEPNWGFVKWTDEEFEHLAKGLKQIAEPSFALIAEVKGKLAGFALALPDINKALKYNKSGSLLGALWHLIVKRKQIDACRIIALGVKPEFQKTGIDAVMYYEIGTRGHNIGIDTGEASWVLEDNLMMNRALQTVMNGEHYKTYRIFDKSIQI